MTANERRPTRPTTYVRELYRLRKAGALDGLGLRSIDLLTHICHLADVFGRDAVFRRYSELAAALRCHERRIGEAVKQLDSFTASGGGGSLVYIDAHRATPGGGYRRATMFQLGPAFPDAARWLNQTDSSGSREDARALASPPAFSRALPGMREPSRECASPPENARALPHVDADDSAGTNATSSSGTSRRAVEKAIAPPAREAETAA